MDGFGVNRPNGDRTAPYWRHVMVTDVYAAMTDGVWLYEPKTHTLLRRLQHDIRAQTGSQEFVASAPLNLIDVAHGERMQDVNTEERRLYLATVFRASIDTAALGRPLHLADQQFVTFAQAVGYPRI